MASSLLTTLTVPDHAMVPRRPMMLLEAMTRRLCPAEQFGTVEICDITPVRSMFDYDVETAIEITELPAILS